MLIPFEQVLALVVVVLVADTLAGVIATGVIVIGLNRRHDSAMRAVEAQHRLHIADMERGHVAEVDALRQRIAALEAQQATLVQLLRSHNIISASDAISVTASSGRLYEAMRTLFSAEELEVLAHEAGLNVEDVGGQTLPVIALRLLRQAQHTGRVAALADAVRRARPNADV